jgi:hypothetical protein
VPENGAGTAGIRLNDVPALAARVGYDSFRHGPFLLESMEP